MTQNFCTQEGLARLEGRKRWDTKERQAALDNLEEFQAKAKRERLRMWRYGDVQSDDEESAPPPRKAGGRHQIEIATTGGGKIPDSEIQREFWLLELTGRATFTFRCFRPVSLLNFKRHCFFPSLNKAIPIL